MCMYILHTYIYIQLYSVCVCVGTWIQDFLYAVRPWFRVESNPVQHIYIYYIYIHTSYIHAGSLSLNGPSITWKKCHLGLHTTQTLWAEFTNHATGHIAKIPLNSCIAFVFSRHLFCEYETESRRISQFHCSHVQGTLAFLQLLSLWRPKELWPSKASEKFWCGNLW